MPSETTKLASATELPPAAKSTPAPAFVAPAAGTSAATYYGYDGTLRKVIDWKTSYNNTGADFINNNKWKWIKSLIDELETVANNPLATYDEATQARDLVSECVYSTLGTENISPVEMMRRETTEALMRSLKEINSRKLPPTVATLSKLDTKEITLALASGNAALVHAAELSLDKKENKPTPAAGAGNAFTAVTIANVNDTKTHEAAHKKRFDLLYNAMKKEYPYQATVFALRMKLDSITKVKVDADTNAPQYERFLALARWVLSVKHKDVKIPLHEELIDLDDYFPPGASALTHIAYIAIKLGAPLDIAFAGDRDLMFAQHYVEDEFGYQRAVLPAYKLDGARIDKLFFDCIVSVLTPNAGLNLNLGSNSNSNLNSQAKSTTGFAAYVSNAVSSLWQPHVVARV